MRASNLSWLGCIHVFECANCQCLTYHEVGGRIEVASMNVLLNARKQPGDGKFCLSKLVMFFSSVSWLVVMTETGGYPVK